MMIRMNRSIAASVVAIAIAAAPGASFAQRDGSFDRATQSAPAKAVVKVQNGIRYLNGGFGAAERVGMVNSARDFNLHMVFSGRKDDAYVEGVNVVIRDVAGKPLFDLAGAGPMLWLELPRGTYIVDSTLSGELKKRIVTVGGTTPSQEYFVWAGAHRAS